MTTANLSRAAAWVLAASVASAGALVLANSGPASPVRDAYAPYLTPQPHPYFVLGLPFGPGDKAAAANAICRLDAYGFREPGVNAAAGRPLAFVVGGAMAFGVMATSPDATIAGQLNRLQSEVFFVSAGMPASRSTQDLLRLTLDIADHHPHLVVVLNGGGDVASVTDPERRRRRLPIGMPPGFVSLLDLVEPPRGLAGLWERFRSLRAPAPPPNVTASEWSHAADIYAANVERMAILAQAMGARFAWTLEPRDDADFDTFRRHVVSAARSRSDLPQPIAWPEQPAMDDGTSITDAANTRAATWLVQALRARHLLAEATR